jgi:hypothetical protein
MEATKAATLERLISQLDDQILAVEHMKYPGTKLLLTMARLDLQAKRHDIGDDELKSLCATVEQALSRNERGRRQASRPPSPRRHARARLGRVADGAASSTHP